MIRMVFKLLVVVCLLVLLFIVLQVVFLFYLMLVVFGDSFSDVGQFFDFVGFVGSILCFINWVGLIYQNGSGEIFGLIVFMLFGKQFGIVLGDLVVLILLVNVQQGIVDGNNWVVGGYWIDQIYDLIIVVNGLLIECDNIFLCSCDGYLVDCVCQGLGVDLNVLYYIIGGGNDFFQGCIFNDVQV